MEDEKEEKEEMKDATSTNEVCFQRLRALGLDPRDKQHHKKLKRASVLVLLYVQDNKLYTLITKRSMNLRSHPGECCFPGGRQDEQDNNNDVQTALREAREEIGLDPNHVDILSRLSTMESINHLCVTSIVAKLKDSVEFENNLMREYPWKINHDEVDQAFGVPLAFFLQDPVSIFEVEWSHETFSMRTYEYHDQVTQRAFSVTGLTAHIVHQVASIAYDTTCPETPTSTTTRSKNKEVTPREKQVMSGYLWKRELSSRGRAYWTRKYFVCTDDTTSSLLHQYDNEQQAHRKAQTATKKNRMPLVDCTIKSLDTTSTSTSVDGESRFDFVLKALGGRIEWHLAAPSSQDRERWTSLIRQRSEQGQRTYC